MKQVVQNLKSGQTEIIDVPIPSIKKRHILIRTAASLVSAGTERNLVEFAQKSLVGKARSRPELMKQVLEKARREGLITTMQSAFNRLDQPLALGYSSAGTVLEIGADVRDFQPGDRVVCAGGGYAVHAEYGLVPINLTAHLPDEVSFEEGAFSTIGAIALNGFRLAKPQLGERIAIIGLGLLGLITAQLADSAGCNVVGMDINPSRLRFAKKIGINALSKKQLIEQYQSLTKGIGFDHVLICADTPSNDTVTLAAQIARDRGHIISLGVVGLDLPRKPFFEKELFFQVSRSSGPGRYDHHYEEEGNDYPIGYVRWTEGRNLAAFVEQIRERKININPLITHTFEISQAIKAYELVTGKIKEDYLGILLKYPQSEVTHPKLLPITAYTDPNLSNNDAIRLGVIGAGNYANAVFIPAIRSIPNISFVAIASSTGLNAQNSARKFGFKIATASEKEIISNPQINTIAVLTRHDSHANLTIKSLRSGKNVYCEKPLALKSEDLKKIEKELIKKNHSHLMVGFNRRFAPFSIKLKEFFKDRSEPVYINYRVNAGYLPPSHWLHQSMIGGGRLIGEACHFIDLVSYLIGKPAVEVNVIGLPDTGKYSQDNFLITMQFQDGSIGSVSYLANGNKNYSKEYLEVFCAGKIGVINDFRSIELTDDQKRKKISSHLRQDKGHRSAFSAFVSSISNDDQDPIQYTDLIHSSYTSLACDYSLKTHQKVNISEFISGV